MKDIEVIAIELLAILILSMMRVSASTLRSVLFCSSPCALPRPQLRTLRVIHFLFVDARPAHPRMQLTYGFGSLAFVYRYCTDTLCI